MHFLFAWRYFKAKKSTNVINIIAWICITAIVIGTAALIMVLSVFNGFEGLVKSLYTSFYPDLKISPALGKVMALTPEQLQKIRSVNGVKNFSLMVEEKALLRSADNQALVHLKGVDENYKKINTISNHIMNGEFDFGSSEKPLIVLGAGIEGSLGVRADESENPLSVYIPRKSESEELDQFNNISSDTVHTSGAFMIQQDFDSKYSITNIGFLKDRLQLNADDYSAVELAVNDADKADQVKKALEVVLGNKYKVENRYQQNQSLYSVMKMERWIFYAVLCLILVVAAFNMVGALTMLVLEKQKDISVLNALGASQGFVQKIFLSEGFLLAFIGGVIGMLLALIMLVIQQKFHIVPLQGGSFLIDYFPVALRITDFILVAFTVLIIAFFASWLPSLKASRQKFSLRSD